jgi:hypothetical protein
MGFFFENIPIYQTSRNGNVIILEEFTTVLVTAEATDSAISRGRKKHEYYYTYHHEWVGWDFHSE